MLEPLEALGDLFALSVHLLDQHVFGRLVALSLEGCQGLSHLIQNTITDFLGVIFLSIELSADSFHVVLALLLHHVDLARVHALHHGKLRNLSEDGLDRVHERYGDVLPLVWVDLL